MILIDFEGFFDGQPLENGSAKNHIVRIGEKKMLKGFEEELIGHTLGEEFKAKVILPANWNNKISRVRIPVPGAVDEAPDDIAVFSIKINELKKKIMPELAKCT